MQSKWASISQLADEVKTQSVSAESLVQKSIAAIKEAEDYKSIVSTLEIEALKRAKEIDGKIKVGEKSGRLAGVPFIAKDNFLVTEGETTASSNMLANFHAPYQATAINKLEEEGAICVAKANLDAFAHGASTENSDFMVTSNPHDKSRVPGGSSGGSAAAVALELAPFALGTDTGGSIRQPASFCGVVGYKPTYGLVSRNGVVAMGSSLDVIGPITRTVEEAALILDVMAGRDELDGTSIERDSASYADPKKHSLKGVKVGVIKEYMSDELNSEVKASVEKSIDALRSNGVVVEMVSLPSLPLALACYYVLCPAEVSSNLGRYDGLRYGYSDSAAKTLEQSYNMNRSNGFGDEAKRRIMIGTYVLSSGYYDAYYQQAQLVRTKIIKEFESVFSNHDFLLGPTAPSPAFKKGEKSKDPLKMYLADVMTVGANLAGIPAISIPQTVSASLPIGLQLMASQHKDRALLEFARSIEEIV